MGPAGATIAIALLVAAAVCAMRLKSRYFRGPNERYVFRPVKLETGPLVSVVIPARDEEDCVGDLIDDLLGQRYRHIEVIVVDDASTDSTAEAVRRREAADARARLASAPQLPPGWTGKCNACRHGVQGARGDYLLFVDCDVRLTDENAVGGLVSYALASPAGLISLIPRQALVGAAERFFLPAIYAIMGLRFLPYGRVNDPADEKAAALGQCLFFRRAAYEAIGGHEAVRGRIDEDMAFARLIKAKGLGLVLLDGGAALSARMYRSLAEIWHGWTKHLYSSAAGGIMPLLWMEAMLCVTFVAPPAILIWSIASLALQPAWLTLAPFILAVGMEIWGHKERVRNYRAMGWPARYEAAFAPAMAFGLFLMAASAVKHWTRGGLSWKGRRYSASQLRA